MIEKGTTSPSIPTPTKKSENDVNYPGEIVAGGKFDSSGYGQFSGFRMHHIHLERFYRTDMFCMLIHATLMVAAK